MAYHIKAICNHRHLVVMEREGTFAVATNSAHGFSSPGEASRYFSDNQERILLTLRLHRLTKIRIEGPFGGCYDPVTGKGGYRVW